jgi:translocation and assembly module TamB
LLGVAAFDVRGPVAIAADFGGRLGDPTVRGTLRADGARLESTLLGTVVENIRVESRFNGSRLEFASFSGRAGRDGTVNGSGTIDLSPERGFPVDLSLLLSRAEVLRRDDLRATVTGPMTVRSGRDRGLISGDLRVDRASFRIGRPATEIVPELVVRERNAASSRVLVPPRPPTAWRLDIRAVADNRVDVDGLGLDSEWQAKLRIGGRADAPEVSGDAELIRGSYEFAGRRFELTRGLLNFTGTYPPDPTVDISAESRIEGLTANIRIGGSAFKPEIVFSSTPVLPEDEVLSRLLFGTSITNLSAPEALQLAGAVASLRQGSAAQNLDVLNVLRRGIGVDRLRILPGDATRGRRAAVAAGEYLGNRAYIEVASDAQGYTSTQLELRLTRSLAILSQVATMGGTSVNLRLSKDY